MADELRDYFCAATVRLAGSPSGVQYALWTARIQAIDLPAARHDATAAIDALGLEYGALDILTESCAVLVIR